MVLVGLVLLLSVAIHAQDQNECNGENGGHDCNPDFADCVNTDGGFTCKCQLGFRDNDQADPGRDCTDVNECGEGLHDCHPLAGCSNTQGSFECVCNSGYTGTGKFCTDQNECNGENGGHDCNPDFADCVNTDGGFSCKCQIGFQDNDVADPGRDCTDINECGEGLHDCNPNAGCTNTQGSFQCVCNYGYTGTGQSCADLNECNGQNGGHDCNPDFADCVNKPGEFSCECQKGFQDNDVADPGRNCTDKDECEENTNICGDFGNCVNTNGFYICNCNQGFFDKDGLCADILECATNPCDVNADCTEAIGSFTCQCQSGYVGTGIGKGTCSDQNECNGENGGNDCNPDFADCVNTGGGFSCECQKGFQDNDQADPGRNCTELPCSGRCNRNAACQVAEDTCTCLEGFTGDGEENCTAIDDATTSLPPPPITTPLPLADEMDATTSPPSSPITTPLPPADEMDGSEGSMPMQTPIAGSDGSMQTLNAGKNGSMQTLIAGSDGSMQTLVAGKNGSMQTLIAGSGGSMPMQTLIALIVPAVFGWMARIFL